MTNHDKSYNNDYAQQCFVFMMIRYHRNVAGGQHNSLDLRDFLVTKVDTHISCAFPSLIHMFTHYKMSCNDVSKSLKMS